MALVQLQLNGVIGWRLESPIEGFQPATQGFDSKQFDLDGIDLDVFDNLFAITLSLDQDEEAEIDLQDFMSLLDCSPVVFTRVVALFMAVSLDSADGTEITIQPGDTNGLEWFFSGGIPVERGGGLLYKMRTDGAGFPVDATHKTIKFTNTGATTGTSDTQFTVIIVGGTG